MRAHNDIVSSTLGVELHDYSVGMEYLDNRTVVYRDIPQAVTGTLTIAPGKEVHVLVADPTKTEGVTMYVNDLVSHDEVFELSGVDRATLGEDEEEELFPGVPVRRAPGRRLGIRADPKVVCGRMFVPVEDDWGEDFYEFVAE